MLTLLLLVPLALLAAVAQAAWLPALPGFLAPDLGLLLGLTALALLPRESALVFLFALGVQADVLGSGRFGLLTLSYLLAGGLLLSVEFEMVRGGLVAAWLAAVIGTGLGHGGYLVLGRWCGLELEWGAGAWFVVQRVVAAALWGGVLACLLRELFSRAKLLNSKAREARARSPLVRAARRWGERMREWRPANG